MKRPKTFNTLLRKFLFTVHAVIDFTIVYAILGFLALLLISSLAEGCEWLVGIFMN